MRWDCVCASGNIQGTFREHAGNMQGTFREHSGNIQGTFRRLKLGYASVSAFIKTASEGAGVSED